MSVDIEWLEAVNKGLMESQERLAAEVIELKRQLEAATKACDDLSVQCRFWRQCAEHAVTGWNKLEDDRAATLDAVRELKRAAAEFGGLDPEHLETLLKLVDDAPDAG